MASTSFDKSASGAASLAALLLLVGVVLVGSFAPACALIPESPDLIPRLPELPEVAIFELQVDNNLEPDNDVNCTITKPVVGTAKSFFIEARESKTVPIQPAQPFSSIFVVEVFGMLPLGGGAQNKKKTYSTGADTLQRGASSVGYRFEIIGPCVENSKPGLLLKGYTRPPSPLNNVGVFINSTCAPLQTN